MGAAFGLGLAYAGQKKEKVLDLLLPVVADNDSPLEVVAVASLSLGLCFLGTCHEDISQALMSVLMERSQETLQKDTLTRLICVAVGLLYLGKQQAVEVALELAKVLEGSVSEYCMFTLETCAYAGTGNVLKVQRFLSTAGEHAPPEEEAAPVSTTAVNGAPAPAVGAAGRDAAGAAGSAGAGGPSTGNASSAAKEKEIRKLDSQSVAVLGVAMVAMGEPLGSEMVRAPCCSTRDASASPNCQ